MPPAAPAASCSPTAITIATVGVSSTSASSQRNAVQNQRAVASATNPAATIGMVAAMTRIAASRTSAVTSRLIAAGMTPSRAINPSPTPETALTVFCQALLAVGDARPGVHVQPGGQDPQRGRVGGGDEPGEQPQPAGGHHQVLGDPFEQVQQPGAAADGGLADLDQATG